MAADPSEVSEGLYMTVEQYLALDEATDGKYEFLDGYVFMLRPPSSDYEDRAVDIAGGSIEAVCKEISFGLWSHFYCFTLNAYERISHSLIAHAAICARIALLRCKIQNL